MSSKGAVPTRDRIVRAATRLFQQRGYHGVGTAEILDEARAPKGSMYHHFPLGKEQVAIAAVQRIRSELVAAHTAHRAQGVPLEETIRRMCKLTAQWLKAKQWRESALFTAISIGAADLPKLHVAMKLAYDEWREYVAMRLVETGWRPAHAQAMAQTVIASIEGAMILVRVDQDERVLIRVGEMMAKLIAMGPDALFP